MNGVSDQEEGNGYFKETSCMNEINVYIGGQIRKYRKANGMTLQRSPFFQAKRLYFYFYDGRYHRLKDGVIDIHEHAERPGTYVASFTLCSVSGNGCSNESYYTGNVVYSDMLIRFTFFNQLNPPGFSAAFPART